MIWLFLFGLILMVGGALLMRSVNSGHSDRLKDKAVVLHSRLKRDQPDNFLAKIDMEEFKVHYLAAVKAKGLVTILPALLAFLALVFALVLGLLTSLSAESLLPFFLIVAIGGAVAFILAKMALKNWKEVKTDEWLLKKIEASAR